ncbi:MAG TPA: hypothetical protein VNT99_10695, partial [Methylomirabilota bacterium]|nr:hypothetical protein [Methylomirabilota bacterium]
NTRQHHLERVSTLEDPIARQAMIDSAKIDVREAQGVLKPYVERLVEAAEKALVPMLAATVEAERTFFESHGLQRKATGVSARVERLAEQVAHFRKSLSEPSYFIHSVQGRNVWSHIFEFFEPKEKTEPVKQPGRVAALAASVVAGVGAFFKA